jgi:hypothetical protein
MSMIEEVNIEGFAEPDEGGAIEYTVSVRMAADAALDGKPDWTIQARYSHFDALRKELAADASVAEIPFPSKGIFASAAPEKRLPELNFWIKALVKKTLHETEERKVLDFLGVFDDADHATYMAKLLAQLQEKEHQLAVGGLAGGMSKAAIGGAGEEEGGGAAAEEQAAEEVVEEGGGGAAAAAPLEPTSASTVAAAAVGAPTAKSKGKKKGKMGGKEVTDNAQTLYNEL